MNEEYEGMELSTRVLIDEALRRGISVEVLGKNDNTIRLRKDSHIEYIKQATKTSADSYIAPLLMENKQVTKQILRESGIKVPEGVTVHSVAEAEQVYPSFSGKAFVIKPKSTNFGKGVKIIKACQSREDYCHSVKEAFQYDHEILIEEFVPGKEYRFLVIGDEVPAVLHRVPANVKGDGIHTIEELVAEKNQDPLRGKGYVTPLEKINLGAEEAAYLKLQGRDFHFIPQNDATVYLRENSNISTGGDSLDFTDIIPEGYKTIALAAARAVGAKICGADIIIQDLAAEPTERNYRVIELNFNPALHIHDFPFQGQNRRVEQKVLDLLGF